MQPSFAHYMTKSGPPPADNLQGDSLDPRPQTIAKKRRGRQKRPSLLSPELQRAIASFAGVIGMPNFQPGGFRDFTGWLDSIAAAKHRSAWEKLSEAVVRELSTVKEQDIPQLKKDVVTEIMQTVVKKRPNESSKLVSTNARRQCAVPPSGTTVMTILESYLSATQDSQAHQDARGHGSSSQASRQPRAGEHASSSSSSRSSGRPHAHQQHQRQHHQMHYQRPPHGSEGKAPRGTPMAAPRPTQRGSASGARSGSRAGGSGMTISSLLADDMGGQLSQPRSARDSAKLPSMSELDEDLRVRKEKDRRSGR